LRNNLEENFSEVGKKAKNKNIDMKFEWNVDIRRKYMKFRKLSELSQEQTQFLDDKRKQKLNLED
jgi:hypothetical protein